KRNHDSTCNAWGTCETRVANASDFKYVLQVQTVSPNFSAHETMGGSTAMTNVAATDAGPAGDRLLVDGLFSRAGRADPHSVLRGSSQVGCRHASARRILRSPNFLPALVSPSEFELFRMFARWLISLDGERHQLMRRAFGGRFAPRAIDTYRAPIQST